MYRSKCSSHSGASRWSSTVVSTHSPWMWLSAMWTVIRNWWKRRRKCFRGLYKRYTCFFWSNSLVFFGYTNQISYTHTPDHRSTLRSDQQRPSAHPLGPHAWRVLQPAYPWVVLYWNQVELRRSRASHARRACCCCVCEQLLHRQCISSRDDAGDTLRCRRTSFPSQYLASAQCIGGFRRLAVSHLVYQIKDLAVPPEWQGLSWGVCHFWVWWR